MLAFFRHFPGVSFDCKSLDVRPIQWLHISDIHIRADQEWSQDVVLKSMCENISDLRQAESAADFILVTGDIAFSGKCKEYALAGKFFDDLQAASGVPRGRIFCIPGNHDIDRTRQKLTFEGALNALNNTSKLDAFLAGGEDLETLLHREQNYRRFQNSLFAGQCRTLTNDGLGYVARIAIQEIHLAIVALDSAWLATGGEEDHGRLLIGERQVIDALQMAQGEDAPPHVVLGMAHHPLHLLQEFDRLVVQNRLEQALHFFHCGHLHQPEVRIAGADGSACLTVATGATYLSRQSHHAFSMVKLDLLNCNRSVSVFRFSAQNKNYYCEFTKDYNIEIEPTSSCSVCELAEAIHLAYPTIGSLAYYLAALVLGRKAELPIPTTDGYTFGSFELFRDLVKGDLNSKTVDFMKFRSVLRVFFGRQPLSNILTEYGSSVLQFGEALIAASSIDVSLRQRLVEHNNDSETVAGQRSRGGFAYTYDLLRELAECQDWQQLRDRAERYVTSEHQGIADMAKRMLALSLAHSDDRKDREEAIQRFRGMAKSESADFTDFGHLAILYADAGSKEEAAKTILDGIERFPGKAGYFSEIGHKIVVSTGDRALRTRIEDAVRGVK